MCLQISNGVLYYISLSFGEIDPFHRKTVISSAKNVQIAFAQAIELTYLSL